MWRTVPLVIRLVTVSLVAFVFADYGTGNGTALTTPLPKSTVAVQPTAPMPRRQERRQRNRRRTTTTTTTTTTTVEPDDADEAEITTPPPTTTVDPRTFDHSK